MFWNRWLKEYLPSLTERLKWEQDTRDLQKGDLVLLQEKNIKRSKWPLARVIEVFPGDDGRVRSVKIKTRDGELIRPSAKLCLLEC